MDAVSVWLFTSCTHNVDTHGQHGTSLCIQLRAFAQPQIETITWRDFRNKSSSYLFLLLPKASWLVLFFCLIDDQIIIIIIKGKKKIKVFNAKSRDILLFYISISSLYQQDLFRSCDPNTAATWGSLALLSTLSSVFNVSVVLISHIWLPFRNSMCHIML